MKYFLLILLLLYVIFAVLAVKYNNPYKLYFLFGKKGSGKSTYMVKYMIKYLKKGWSVYTDMPDVNITGVHLINAKDLEHFTPKDHSALFLDEIGLTFDNRKFKSFPDGVNQWFKFQRKYHVTCFINSQSADVDLKIRALIDKMYLMQSIGNVVCLIRPIRRTITLTAATGDAESRIADQLVFEKFWHWRIVFLPRYFRYFDSFSAPARPELPGKIISEGVQVLRGRDAKRILKEIQDSERRQKILETPLQ